MGGALVSLTAAAFATWLRSAVGAVEGTTLTGSSVGGVGREGWEERRVRHGDPKQQSNDSQHRPVQSSLLQCLSYGLTPLSCVLGGHSLLSVCFIGLLFFELGLGAVILTLFGLFVIAIVLLVCLHVAWF
jgi:hypothetical protein